MHAQQLALTEENDAKTLKFLTQAIQRSANKKQLHILYLQALISQDKIKDRTKIEIKEQR